MNKYHRFVQVNSYFFFLVQVWGINTLNFAFMINQEPIYFPTFKCIWLNCFLGFLSVLCRLSCKYVITCPYFVGFLANTNCCCPYFVGLLTIKKRSCPYFVGLHANKYHHGLLANIKSFSFCTVSV